MVRCMTRLLTCCLALLVPLPAHAADKMTKETFDSGGRTRTYYLLVPEPKYARYQFSR
jgi:poly(3-hydroxybutyrate) depolymerase